MRFKESEMRCEARGRGFYTSLFLYENECWAWCCEEDFFVFSDYSLPSYRQLISVCFCSVRFDKIARIARKIFTSKL